MKILVIGGMHGNEPLGLAVVDLFKQSPAADVDVVLANEAAISKNCRFISADLNRSFPGSADESYEQKRAAELLRLCQKYDVVLDFHNTHCSDNDCGFVGQTADQRLYDVASCLGLRRIIVADYDCINRYASNCLSVEISLDSPAMDAKLWYQRIARLAALKDLAKAEDIQTYRFVYRMTLEDRDRLALPDKRLRAFEVIDEYLAVAMNVVSPAYPIFVADTYTPYNYGGLLNKIG